MKLNIGAGATMLEGFTPIDRKNGGEAYPLQMQVGEVVEDESVEEIRASHILEHFPFERVPEVLTEWLRVLKPGGICKVAVPDIDKVMNQRKKGDQKWPRYLMGGQVDSDDFHYSVFTEIDLRGIMEDIGFVDVRKWESDNTDTAAHPVSLNLEGRKGGVEPDRVDNDTLVRSEGDAPVLLSQDAQIKICALMSLPRYGNNICRGSIESALKTFNIPLNAYTGAYWGHHLQDAMETMVSRDIDWLITFDHDTLCCDHHLDRLMGHLGRNPHIDAIAALEARRNHDTPLLTIKGKTRTNITGQPIKVATAHFGMTIIRVDALKRCPLPWFWELPTKWGSWNDDSRPPVKVCSWVEDVWKAAGYYDDNMGTFHMDEDIFFWKQWERCGNTVYVAPDVRIGHVEEVVSDFDENMEPRRQRLDKWQQRQNREKNESQTPSNVDPSP